jgi:hypothetical protein
MRCAQSAERICMIEMHHPMQRMALIKRVYIRHTPRISSLPPEWMHADAAQVPYVHVPRFRETDRHRPICQLAAIWRLTVPLARLARVHGRVSFGQVNSRVVVVDGCTADSLQLASSRVPCCATCASCAVEKERLAGIRIPTWHTCTPYCLLSNTTRRRSGWVWASSIDQSNACRNLGCNPWSQTTLNGPASRPRASTLGSRDVSHASSDVSKAQRTRLLLSSKDHHVSLCIFSSKFYL